MNHLRFYVSWVAALIASFAAILFASGGQVIAPRPDYQNTIPLARSTPPAFESGTEKERTSFSPSGSFYIEGLVDPSIRGSRALRSHSVRSADWKVSEIQEADGMFRYHILEAPVLEIFDLRYNEQKQAISDWLQTRITAREGIAKLRNTNLAELDPEVPIKLRDAVVEMDEEGDSIFETTLTASDLSCRVETQAKAKAKEDSLPLREMIAQGLPDQPVRCVFGDDLETSADRWEWRPHTANRELSIFDFGPNLLAEMNNRRDREAGSSQTMTLLSCPSGGRLTLNPPHLDELEQPWRRARFDIPDQFKVDQTLMKTDQAPKASSIEGREAWFEFMVSERKPGGEGSETPVHETDDPLKKKKGKARFIAARVEHDLIAIGTFGTIHARAATFDFMPDEENRVRVVECEGPIVFTPPKDSDWVTKLFGKEGGSKIQGDIELRCQEGATIRRPEDLDLDRDGYIIELRGDVVLAVENSAPLLKAGRWLRLRVEEPPAEVLKAKNQEAQAEEPATKLEPRWMEAEQNILLDHMGNIGRGGRLRVDFEGWGDEAVRTLVLTESPKIRVLLDEKQPPLDLSCIGPMILRLGNSGLESAELSNGVRVEPIEEDSSQMHLTCDHLIVAGNTRETLSIDARGNVRYDEADRHVRCAVLKSTPSGGISVLGTPAHVSVLHEGEPFELRALWIGYNKALGTLCALGLAQRVELDPPASMARIDFSGVKKEGQEVEEPVTAPAQPIHISAHFLAADLTPERTRVLGMGRVKIDGQMGAHADWLWASQDRLSQLTLGSIAGRRIQFSSEDEVDQVRGSARRMVWSEKEQGLRLLGAPRVRWTGTLKDGFDLLPGSDSSKPEKQTYDLRADESFFLSKRIVRMQGSARVVQVGDRPFEVGGDRLTLNRNEKTGKPENLDLLHDAYAIVPGETKTAPNLLEVRAHQIIFNVVKQELNVHGNKQSKAVFSMQSQPEEVQHARIDLKRYIVLGVRR